MTTIETDSCLISNPTENKKKTDTRFIDDHNI